MVGPEDTLTVGDLKHIQRRTNFAARTPGFRPQPCKRRLRVLGTAGRFQWNLPSKPTFASNGDPSGAPPTMMDSPSQATLIGPLC